LTALQKLPFSWGTVWRGRKKRPHDISTWEVGQCVVWKGFSSTSTSKAEAVKFAGPDGTLFEIESFSGRSIKDFSLFPIEDEVLFPTFSGFTIESVSKQSNSMLHVTLKESTLWFGNHVLLWVDDHPKNNKEIMEKVAAQGVSIVCKATTGQALEWLERKENLELLTFNTNKFRIITDMARMEHGINIVDAGKNLIEALRKKTYNEEIFVFPSTKRQGDAENTVKNHGLVKVSCSTADCLQYCSFQPT